MYSFVSLFVYPTLLLHATLKQLKAQSLSSKMLKQVKKKDG